ncbi:MAG: hypothetical protein GWN79_25900, partial [Actinobacteria bacterium]|nr:hypothetical protein [Actinomycetota bacterium]NIS36312.1 hypothetical protein [Actinomycetota bacterium]NIT98654.1 hypothetical protein [Actinomycetota bacterium]NIU22270.1 hypothetical protein [Actinomycetota bacterium]NIU70857.1 hypothetical protein [Actinomycetota bacterium]
IDDARAQLTFRLVDSPQEVKDLIGLTDDRTTALRAALAEGGPRAAAHLVDPEWVPSFVISGTEAECAAELTQLMADNDIDEFQLPVLDIDGAAAFIERTAALLGG